MQGNCEGSSSPKVVIPRAGDAEAGYPVRCGLSFPSLAPLEYWVARSSRAMASESVARSFSSNTTPHSRGAECARVVHEPCAQKNGGRGECRVRVAPAASHANVKMAHEGSHHRDSRDHPAFPHAMVLRLISRSPRRP